MRHAFVAARSRIGIGGAADARLLGVVELAAARGRDEIHAGFGELHAEIDRVLDVAAALDAFVGEEAAADREVLAASVRAPP